MIIVEGADNTGKTRLISELLALDPALRLLHRERFKPQAGENIYTSYFDMLVPRDTADLRRHAYSIADRCVASECIYGSELREGCRMTVSQHFVLRSLLRGFHAVIVHCDPPDEVVQRSWLDREQYPSDPLRMLHAYRARLAGVFPGHRIIRYDWSASDASDMRQRILDYHFMNLMTFNDANIDVEHISAQLPLPLFPSTRS